MATSNSFPACASGLVLLIIVASGCRDGRAPVRSAAELADEPPFTYHRYDAPREAADGTTNGGGLPLSIALDAEGNAWVLGEFHTELQHVAADEPLTATIRIPIPLHPQALPFRSRRGAATRMSMLGEGLIVDDGGLVWLSQGGGYLIREGENHSRVLSYEPTRGAFRAFNLPGNRNEAMGLLWDPERGLIWVAESGISALLAFDPNTAPHDNGFLWDRPLDDRLCRARDAEARGCFRRYTLPEAASSPAQLAKDGSGAIWFTLFWGAAIGRLQPETGEVQIYPLAAALGADFRSKVVGPGPWDIEVSTDGAHVVWTEFFDATIARLSVERANDPECQQLTDGKNPCVEEVRVSEAEPGSQQVHSLAFDRFGNLWFTQFTFPAVPGIRNSIGFIAADWSHTVFLDARDIHPAAAGSYTGITVDPRSGDIWIAEFIPPAVGRLSFAAPDVDPTSW